MEHDLKNILTMQKGENWILSRRQEFIEIVMKQVSGYGGGQRWFVIQNWGTRRRPGVYSAWKKTLCLSFQIIYKKEWSMTTKISKPQFQCMYFWNKKLHNTT